MSKICDIDESGDVLVTYTTSENKGLKTVSFVFLTSHLTVIWDVNPFLIHGLTG